MKLYAYIPSNGCHGPTSFYVMSKSKEVAKEKIEKYLDSLGIWKMYESEGWEESEHELIILDENQVISNAND